MSIDLGTIITICGCISAIAAVFGLFSNFFKKQVQAVTKEQIEATAKDLKDHLVKTTDDLKDQMEEFITECRQNDERHKSIIISSCRARINESYSHYMEKGSISSYALSILEDIYEQYQLLGGNNLAKEQMSALNKLPRSDDVIKNLQRDRNEHIN